MAVTTRLAVATAVAAFAALITGLQPAGAAAGPAYVGDFPDPFVLRVGGTYHAFATQTGTVNVQHTASSNLGTWQPVIDALPILPLWRGRVPPGRRPP